MNFKKINNITGWAVCLVACLVYILTMEATGSLWDCGEFASSAYKLQIPHPPGAPLFVLIGRLFMAPFPPATAATGINLMSALASGFTILFLFWSITHFARKLLLRNKETLTPANVISIMGAGVVGALAYTFSDSFWYSAVEGEVYALSSFFTAVVFWAMLKWEQSVTEEQAEGIKGHFTRADRWLILIFYLMGLSIGVHLLNLLTIPAIVVIYYYKRYNVTAWGVFWAFVIGCLITGLVQKAVIQWTIKGAGMFDVLFVNSFGLPFFTGFAFFFIFLGVLIYFGLNLARRKNWNFLRLGLWSFAFMLLGYSTYFTTMVRSTANPSVDMYNVDNPVSLVGYLSRDQYGDWPILYGQDFTAQVQDTKVTETYVKSKTSYEKNGRKLEYVYAPGDLHFFPRMWDQSNDQNHADYYANWAGITKDKEGNYDRAPTMSENIGFFLSYQLNWMYWRYFMWNFAGKQNDVQGIYMGNVRDGNWKTGIGFYDNIRLGDQDAMPDTMKHNKANNKLFMLPFILGLLGLYYQYKKDRRDAFIVGLLFFFTGFAICIYLNQAAPQPRERDYAYVGSFYAFAIWIGLGVLFLRQFLEKYIKNGRNAALAASVLALLLVPVIMATQEWDDHDRSKKTIARDLAIDYLESCAPNAILITFGDNDTYPLWYAQEVQGIRTDIRVINSSLMGTDWYLNELRYKVNQSAPIDPIWSAEQIEGSKREVVYYVPKPVPGGGEYMDLYTMMKDYAGSDNRDRMEQGRDGSLLNSFPSKKVSVPVDASVVRANGTVSATDSIVSSVNFEIPKQYLYKNDAAILNIIAANGWKRPIYFTSPYSELGFGNYLRQDGLSYRLVPVANSEVNKDWVFDKMMNKFAFGNANIPGVYYDEENRRHLNTIKLAYGQAAMSLAEAGRKDDAKRMLRHADSMMLQENFPYGLVSRSQQHNQFSLQFLYAAYSAGDMELAEKITGSLKKDIEQQAAYYQQLPQNKRDALAYEEDRNENMMKGLLSLEQQFKNKPATIETPGQIKMAPAGKDSGKP
ncbi:MAG: DUF2723 domain-containing protein [Ferruginibacter sp.]